MPLLKETKHIQEQLGRYCQTGDLIAPLKGAQENRLPHYRRLVFNVVKDALRSAYPLTRKLVGEDNFNDLCYRFFANHACQEQQVFKMTGEFYEYLSEAEPKLHVQYPWIDELLLFEWTEMDMYMMEDISAPPHKPNGNWQTDILILNPESRLIQFSYPVFKKAPLEIHENDKSLYYCLAYRSPKTGQIFFVDLSPVMAVVISQLGEERPITHIYNELTENGVSLNPAQKESLLTFLKEESKKGLILGFKA